MIGRMLLAMASAILAIGTGVLATSLIWRTAPTPPRTCEGPERVGFGDGSTAPICELRISFGAVGGLPMLAVSGRLPAQGPYGVGEDLAAFGMTIYRYRGPGEYTGGGTISILPHRYGWPGIDAGADWSGTCRVAAGKLSLGIRCDLRGSARGAALLVTADLPPPPDPHDEPGLRWLEVRYAFKGDYAAAATVEAALDAHADGRLIEVPLADGGLLVILPEGREPDGRVAVITLSARPMSPPGESGIPEWRPEEETPSLGACTISPSANPFDRSITCSGDAHAASGSATLKASWRPAP